MSGWAVSGQLVGGSAAVVVAVVLGVAVLRGRRRDLALAEMIELPWGEREVPAEAVSERPTRISRAVVAAAEAAARRFDRRGSLARTLERAHVPLRPGEVVVLTACGGMVAAAAVALITREVLFGSLGLVVAPLVASVLLKRRIAQRRRALLEAFPDALGLIAASLQAGHTFLRAIQLMCEDTDPVLADEFGRVVAECELGDPLPDALERMAGRLDIRDIDWAVQAIRVQQEVGGRLADVLRTLADFMRAREEVRREVQALTAEGRMSAWVLGGLPVFLVLAVQTSSPDYLDPLLRGWGILALAGSAASVALGIKLIFRMVRSIEV